jgi:hypothetical protein
VSDQPLPPVVLAVPLVPASPLAPPDLLPELVESVPMPEEEEVAALVSDDAVPEPIDVAPLVPGVPLVPALLEPLGLAPLVLPMLDPLWVMPDAIVPDPDEEMPSAAIVFESRRPLACMP